MLLFLFTGLLAGCTTTTSTTVAGWAGAFTCAATDAALAVLVQDMRWTVPGTTAALVVLPLAYGGDLAAAFAGAC